MLVLSLRIDYARRHVDRATTCREVRLVSVSGSRGNAVVQSGRPGWRRLLERGGDRSGQPRRVALRWRRVRDRALDRRRRQLALGQRRPGGPPPARGGGGPVLAGGGRARVRGGGRCWHRRRPARVG